LPEFLPSNLRLENSILIICTPDRGDYNQWDVFIVGLIALSSKSIFVLNVEAVFLLSRHVEHVTVQRELKQWEYGSYGLLKIIDIDGGVLFLTTNTRDPW
jgi:hypothetical protein